MMRARCLTLQELLAGVLAEEGVVNNRTVKVVDHELEDRLDVTLGVAGVVGKGGVPLTTLKDSTGKVHGGSSDMARRVLEEAVVEAANLKEILSECAGLDVVVVGLGDTAEEVHGVWVGEVVVQGTKDETLSLEDLGLGEAVVGNVLEVLNVGREDFLVLGSDEHGGDTNELEAVELDDLAREEAVDDVDCQEEGLRQQPKTRVNLEKPVNKDAAHLPLELILAIHVVRVGKGGDLKFLHVVEDLVHVLGNHERVIKVLFVEVLCLLGQFLQGLVVQLIVVKCEVLGSESCLGLGLLDGSAILGWRNVLGQFLVEFNNRGRLNGAALLDDGATDTRAASRSLQFRRGGVGRPRAESSPSGGGTRSGLLHASRLRGLRCERSLAQSTLFRVCGLDRVVPREVALVPKGGTLGWCCSGTLGDGGLCGRVSSGVVLERSSFGTRHTRDWCILCVLVGDSPAGSNSLYDTSIRVNLDILRDSKVSQQRGGVAIHTGGIVDVMGSR